MNLKYYSLKFKELFVKYKIRRNLILGGVVFLTGIMLSGSVNPTTSNGVLWITFIVELTILWAFGDTIKFTKADRIELVNYLKHGNKKIDTYIDQILDYCCNHVLATVQMDETVHFQDKLFIDIGCFRLYIRRDNFKTPSIAYKKVIREDELIVEKYNSMFHAKNSITHSSSPKKEWELENAFKDIQEMVRKTKEDDSVFIYPNTDHYPYFKQYLIKFAEYNPNTVQHEFERLIFELRG